jgi:hypothetical protein
VVVLAAAFLVDEAVTLAGEALFEVDSHGRWAPDRRPSQLTVEAAGFSPRERAGSSRNTSNLLPVRADGRHALTHRDLDAVARP